ncbi:hypothetical protein [Paraliomyxa miuraensis]|uniref:hypothetical protein n=1 Tax=Paraliomyxa miuraensis TaxID=376150 RepID=UPI002250CD18|nr:hypothetical protein [Paraliomyxa miuraensis]MCX4241315.1 UPF0489 family protein [Paraliomyxa miuraensis]
MLPIWYRHALRGATIITLDAHLDLRAIDPERIEALHRCRDAARIESRQAPVCWASSTAWSYDLEDFLLAAWSLGLIGRVLRVARSCPDPLRWAEHLTSVDGVGPCDLDSLEPGPHGPSIELFGVPVVATALVHLASLDARAPRVLDIDLDYFVDGHGVPWIEVEDVLAQLDPLRPRLQLLTIARSVDSGFHPLRYRHLAEHLAAWWNGDDEAREHYVRLADLDARARRGEAVVGSLAREAERWPSCAATRHLLALCDAPHASMHHEAAARLDPAYRDDPARDAAVLVQQSRTPLPEQLHRLACRLEHERDVSRRGWGHVALGLLWVRAGCLPEAAHHHLEARARVGRNGLLLHALGDAWLRRGERSRARPCLRAALDDPRVRGRAALLLGNDEAREGRLSEAEALLSVACDAFSLAERPWRLLAQLRAATGDEPGANAASERADAIAECITRTHARLGGHP